MSPGAYLSRAEKLIVDIESYVNGGAWHPGRNLQIAFESEEVDNLLRQFEMETTSVMAVLPPEQIGKVTGLRKRWLLSKENILSNPWE